jgi:NADH:ubiquinone oxidoreductase subunit 5 (subunit L)/multisubunit Na+/H+ antiporter MnhA subunit
MINKEMVQIMSLKLSFFKCIFNDNNSQLGMMVIAVGLSSYNVALFHLINHAFYKALLFLGAGSVIHAVADNQDFRKYGGLRAFLPLTYSVMLIASLSLVAFPYMTGFYSKDFILESAYGQFYFSSIVVYFIATIAAIFTTLYSVKVLYLTFLANPLGPLNSYKNAHEGDIYMSLPANRFWKSIMWVWLSNSGKSLKILIPSYIWKIINGWFNYSCKVIRQNIMAKLKNGWSRI